MALNKQSIDISFARGLDLKTDPFRVPIGSFLELENSVFTKQGLLQKRFGYAQLTPLPNTDSLTTLGTFNGGLIAVGDEIQLYSSDSGKWTDRGNIENISLNVVPAVRTNTGQVTSDLAITSTGLSCVAWQDTAGAVYYQVLDSGTGNIIISPTLLAASGASPRCYILGNHFVVTFLALVLGVPHLQYVAIPVNDLTMPGTITDLSTTVSGLTAGYDAVVANNTLYLAWNGSDGGGAVRVSFLTSTFVQSAPIVNAGFVANLASVAADLSGVTPVIWVTAYETASQDAYTWAYSPSLINFAAVNGLNTISGVLINEITSIASDGVMTLLYETSQNYSYAAVASDYVSYETVSQAGVVGSPNVVLRSLGLASKPFYNPVNGDITFLATYGGVFQPTYFLVDIGGDILAKLAYSNGIGYATSQVLFNVTVMDNTASMAYLFSDLIQAVNKEQGLANPAGVYAQKGMNIAMFHFNEKPAITAEIGGSLHLTGGFLWQYDGVKPVEFHFHLWPESVVVTTAGAPVGNIAAGTYFYQATYEWTDAAGNIHRSAPSVPSTVVVGAPNSTNTINVPTLRLTAKTGVNSVRIVLYRWSLAQQNYYQVTSITNPITNDPAVDSIAILDGLSDAQILGNNLIYTTGGVVENIAPPAVSLVTLYKSRLFAVPSEDPNNIWYSKQVISATPVETSDLFTLYVAPTTSAQGSTGATMASASMDDKLIFFKSRAIYYIVGNGPDNTGANNDFSEPVFINSTVGCDNQRSIVFMPQGLMFQAADGKGIWLLGRDLSTTYIGAPVEDYNNSTVLSAINVPGTNQVRFTLSNGVTLMYDYFYGQWGTFTNIPAQSSVVFEGLHTYLNSFGLIFQENPGSYLDGSNPVLMSFVTSWINLGILQGYQRAYYFFLLGTYISPHLLNVHVAYDYNSSPEQGTIIYPDNVSNAYGDEQLYGSGSPYGGPGNIEQWHVYLNRQKCQSVQISIAEVFNNNVGQAAGAGLTLSGINMVIGSKKGYPVLKRANATG